MSRRQPRLRRLEANAVRLGLLRRLADLNHLAVEIDAFPAQRQDLAEPHVAQEAKQGREPQRGAFRLFPPGQARRGR